MTDKPTRVLPSSRQPVTPEAHASATTETGGPSFSDPGDGHSGGHDVAVGATNPVWPTTSSLGAEAAVEEARTATLEDATRFAGGTTDMHQGGDHLTLPPGMPETSGGHLSQGDRTVADESSTAGTAMTGVESGLAPGASAAAGMAGGATALSGGASGRHAASPTTSSSAGSSSPSSGDKSSSSASSRPPQRARSEGPRSAEDIERDIEETRSRLAGTVDEINDRVKPANIKARAQTQARGLVMSPDGQVRTERVGPVAGVLAALLLIRLWRSRHRRK